MSIIRLIALACLLCLRATNSDALDTRSINWQPVIGRHIPMDLQFHNETDQPVLLAHYFGQRPVILMLGYFKCQSLCPETFAGVMQSLQQSDLSGGQDYELVIVSIDPMDTATTAALIKQHSGLSAVDLENRYTHFLTGNADAIAHLTKAVEFGYIYDGESQQFAHPAGLLILTSTGVISQYLPGVRFSSAQLRDGIFDAKHNLLSSVIQRLRLLCYHLDVQTGRYTLKVMRLMQAVGVTSVIMLVLMWFRQRKTP